MALIEIWRRSPEQFATYAVRQIVSFAGDGKLTDGNECAKEFREFLSNLDSAKICEYVEQCLADTFPDSGFVLQDLVNELARRLDYDVTNGRYRGVTNQIGFDGVWKSPEENFIIAEVKTTDTYRINLEKLAAYRSGLTNSGTVTEKSSILIVVGRQDTGDLEAQIRGSRHAWDIRLLSAVALGKLVLLKEEAGDESTAERIRSLLIPLEYTRLDPLIDVVFTTAEDIRRPAEEIPEDTTEQSSTGEPSVRPHSRTEINTLENTRKGIVSCFSRMMKKDLIKKSKAQFWTSDKGFRVCCTVSKPYEKSGTYWYAHHENWQQFLLEGDDGYLILGCVGTNVAFALPVKFLTILLDKLNATERPDGRKYWHLHLANFGKQDYRLRLKGAGQTTSVNEYKFELS
jgi:hypothetical protein